MHIYIFRGCFFFLSNLAAEIVFVFIRLKFQALLLILLSFIFHIQWFFLCAAANEVQWTEKESKQFCENRKKCRKTKKNTSKGGNGIESRQQMERCVQRCFNVGGAIACISNRSFILVCLYEFFAFGFLNTIQSALFFCRWCRLLLRIREVLNFIYLFKVFIHDFP